MLVTRKSLYSGVENTMDLDITPDQLKQWRDGVPLDECMPDLNYDQVEFMKTGCLPDEYDDMFDNANPGTEYMGHKVQDWEYD